MDLLHYVLVTLPEIGSRALRHVYLVSIAVGIATLTGVPLGVIISQHPKLARLILRLASILMTVPSVALFGALIPILAMFGQGIGAVPAIIAVFLYSQLPIVRNSYTAMRSIDPSLHEAAAAIGMSQWQRLNLVEIPLAVPLIMAGVRTAVTMNIGVMAIATYIGAGGLGAYISQGISQSDTRQLLVGAISLSILSMGADWILSRLQRAATPTGILKRDFASLSQRRRNLVAS
jgi:osmoprotectant transport system permease protein